MLGTLKVKPIAAKLTRDTEWVGKMDPYVKIRLGGAEKVSSIQHGAGKFPSWGDEMVFERRGEYQIDIQVWDYDTMSKDDLIGETSIPLQNTLDKKQSDDWYTISYKGRPAGQIRIVMNWDPPKITAQNATPVLLNAMTSHFTNGQAGNPAYNPGYPGYMPMGHQGYSAPPAQYAYPGSPPGGPSPYPPQNYAPQAYPPQASPPQGYHPQSYPSGPYPPQGAPDPRYSSHQPNPYQTSGAYPATPPNPYQQNPPNMYQSAPPNPYQPGPPGMYPPAPQNPYNQAPPNVYPPGGPNMYQSLPTGPNNPPNQGHVSMSNPNVSPYQSVPPGPSYQAGPPGPSYQTGPPGPSYQTNPPGPSYQTNPTGPSHHTNPPGPSYQTNPPGPSYQTNPPGPTYQTNPPGPSYQTNPPGSSSASQNHSYTTSAPSAPSAQDFN